jgi:Ser/Thr protein kinase RdoA (MazF antagonist)
MSNFDRPNSRFLDIGQIIRLFCMDLILGWRDVSGVPNVTVIVELFGGRSVVVRACNNGYTSVPHLAAEVDVLQYLASSGFPLSPRLVRGLNGDYVQAWRGYRVIAMEYIAGAESSASGMSLSTCSELGSAVGELSRKLEVCPVVLPDDESFVCRTEKLLESALSAQDWTPWPLSQRELARLWSECSGLFAEQGLATGLIHSDIWPPNVLVDEELTLVGIVDFDDLATGPIVMEIAAAFGEFAVESPAMTFSRDRGAALTNGYRVNRNLTGLEVNYFDTCVTVSYIGWFCCNLFHGADVAESMIYADRLKSLSSASVRDEFRLQLQSLLS